MRKLIVVLALALLLPFVAPAPHAYALSCLPVDMYLENVLKEESGEFVFTGTATEVTKNHTQVVTVTKVHKGWVAPKMWVNHNYSTDWQYFCSNGPAKAGEPTVFIVMIDEFGSFDVTQTLQADSAQAKAFVKSLEDADTDAGITEATPADRASEVIESVKNILTALGQLLGELAYWQSQK